MSAKLQYESRRCRRIEEGRTMRGGFLYKDMVGVGLSKYTAVNFEPPDKSFVDTKLTVYTMDKLL